MLRLASATDVSAILLTRTAAIRALASAHYSKSEIDEWCSSRTAETCQESIESHAVIVEEVDGEVVAFGQLNRNTSVVEGIYVRPTHLRQGIGLRVLRALEEMAARHGIKSLTLHASLNAVEFYRLAGYVPVREDEQGFNQKTKAAIVAMRHEIQSYTKV